MWARLMGGLGEEMDPSGWFDLVTHLGPMSRDEIFHAMERMAIITGWGWGTIVGGMVLPLAIGDMKQHLELEGETGSGSTAGACAMNFKGQPRYIHLIRDLRMHPVQEPGGHMPSLVACHGCQCGVQGLVMKMSQHDIVEEMPALHELLVEFNSDLAPHGKGVVGNYLNWLVFHMVDRQRVSLSLEKEHGPGARDIIAWYLENPPIRSNHLAPGELSMLSGRLPSFDERTPNRS